MDQSSETKILITGGTGFVGTELCRVLVQKPYVLRLFTRKAVGSEFQYNDKVSTIVGELQDHSSLHLACSGQEVVVHLAGTAHVNASEAELRRTIVDGTKNLLEAATANQVRRFIYISSSLAEEAEQSDTVYGRCKREAEHLVLQANLEHGLETLILRPVNVYGVGMRGNIAGMISLIARNRLPPLPRLNTRISLVSVTDLVQAIELALVAEFTSAKTYTVTDGQEYLISDIEQAIYGALHRRFPRWRTPRMVLFAAALVTGIIPRPGHSKSAIGLRTYRNITHDNLFENHAICHDLGFQPSTTLYQKLPSIVENILQKTRSTVENKQ